MSLNPLLRSKRDVDQGLEVVEAERAAIAPFTGLILKRPREGRCEERALLAGILPDRGLDVAGSQCMSGVPLLVAISVSPWLKCWYDWLSIP